MQSNLVLDVLLNESTLHIRYAVLRCSQGLTYGQGDQARIVQDVIAGTATGIFIIEPQQGLSRFKLLL